MRCFVASGQAESAYCTHMAMHAACTVCTAWEDGGRVGLVQSASASQRVALKRRRRLKLINRWTVGLNGMGNH